MLKRVLALLLAVAPGAFADEAVLDITTFQRLEPDLGPDSSPHYGSSYTIEGTGADAFLHATYQPAGETLTMYHQVPDSFRRGIHRLRWRWRALTLPRGGNECVPDHGDSAANVYVTWKRGLRWYTLKFVWSTDAPVGATCNRTRNAFVASDSIVLRSGGPLGEWREENVDLDALFREHFGERELPELQGVGVLSDGDETKSRSAADFGSFTLTKLEPVSASPRP